MDDGEYVYKNMLTGERMYAIYNVLED
jgi:hypothetical protein